MASRSTLLRVSVDPSGDRPVAGVEVESAPRSTLADLDEALLGLLTRELEAVGIGPVAVMFDAPERDRVASWPSPALNLFLYDVREAVVARDRTWRREGLQDGRWSLVPGVLRLDCSYAITVWARSPVDEHRLLSQVLSILVAYPLIPPELLGGDLLVGDPPAALPARVAQGKEEGRADFWTAIGSPYKVSIEYVVTALVAPSRRRPLGPPTEQVDVTLGDETDHAPKPDPRDR